jgi:hypothetical protein
MILHGLRLVKMPSVDTCQVVSPLIYPTPSYVIFTHPGRPRIICSLSRRSPTRSPPCKGGIRGVFVDSPAGVHCERGVRL